MEYLSTSSIAVTANRARAIQDAKATQAALLEMCNRENVTPPQYKLEELTGKGTFGRVYRAKHLVNGKLVAVKIINIDQGDSMGGKGADTLSDFMKEVNALRTLSDTNARNINHVIDALPVGENVWLVTEYCGGGSIATLMKPTPSGLREVYILPILREVAVAIDYVHKAGIIHRDIKCANVLITEEGGIQLCDFGVAGIAETSVDKRSTVIGTPHWMAPELFKANPSYGKEVDIWAYGSFAYEMATGLPPSAREGVRAPDIPRYLQDHIPRLEGDRYSSGLKSIIEACLQEEPRHRPVIGEVLKHDYIADSSEDHPTTTLIDLVKAFKKWEEVGGSRKSLFMPGGAVNASDNSPDGVNNGEWRFSTSMAFDLKVDADTNAEDVVNVYGDDVDMQSLSLHEPQQRANRRRGPPQALAPMKQPLEKVFDLGTSTDYASSSASQYGLRELQVEHQQPSTSLQNQSDLALRDNFAQASVRESVIDLGEHDAETGISTFAEADTIKAEKRIPTIVFGSQQSSSTVEVSIPSLSDSVDIDGRRNTRAWKFPDMSSIAPLQPPMMTPGSGQRPALHHHPTEPIQVPTQSSSSLLPSAPNSPNRLSLIDLDASVPDPMLSRPSTAGSASSVNDFASTEPFNLERHMSIQSSVIERAPSLYFDGETNEDTSNKLREMIHLTDLSASDTDTQLDYMTDQQLSSDSISDTETQGRSNDDGEGWDMEEGHLNGTTKSRNLGNPPALPPPPSTAFMTGSAGHWEEKAELDRIFTGMTEQLESFKDEYMSLLQ